MENDSLTVWYEAQKTDAFFRGVSMYKQGLILFGFASDLYQICAEDTAADLQALMEKIKTAHNGAVFIFLCLNCA